MKSPVIETRILDALEMIGAVLEDEPLLWAITGSLGMALQGLPVSVRDIDLQTDQAGAYAMEAALSEFVVQPVALRESESIRSHFGKLEIEGVEVEIMGDIQHRQPDRGWNAPVELAKQRRWVNALDHMLPVMAISYEAEAYRRMGRMEKAAMLQAWAELHPEDRVEAITNYLEISPALGTGGQPLELQIGVLAQAGYQSVINLARADLPYALQDEAGLVARHGMTYHPIPVVWGAPTLQNLADFFAAMQANAGRRVFVHCALNMRVSCFVFLYRVLQQGEPQSIARADLERIWQPNGIWQAFLRQAGQAYGIDI